MGAWVTVYSRKPAIYLWNGARYDQSYYWWLIVIRAFDWCQNQRLWLGWPWTAITYSVSKYVRFRSPPQKFEWRYIHTVSGENVGQWLVLQCVLNVLVFYFSLWDWFLPLFGMCVWHVFIKLITYYLLTYYLLVSGSIKFIRIFVGFPGEEASNDSG